MDFIDAHLHFGGREDEILSSSHIYAELRELGLKKVYLLCFTTYGLDFSDSIRVAPFHARPHYHPDYVDADSLLVKVRGEIDDENFIIPFLDFRIIHGDIEAWLDHYMRSGYKGLKTLFIPEYDDFLQVESPIEILKISKSAYLDNQQRVMDYGEQNNFPVICHMNLLEHFDYAKEFFSVFPNLHINIPHLGFSRKKMSLLFDNFENCYSDISGLMDYIEKSPKGYGDYIEHYKDRIMFGTDCAWNESEKTKGYLSLIKGLPLQDSCMENLFYNTALRFLGKKQ
ncbi:MAG: amidohydrolase family protein [Desulfobacterales bacterium]|nr:amidohydrolase family protein [Desulfobacterales bacterium]